MHRFGALPRGPAMWALALLFVMIGWVFFRSATLAQAMHFLATMFGFSRPSAVYYELPAYLTLHSATFILIGLFFALAPFERFSMRLGDTPAQVCVRATCAVALFACALVQLSAHSFNPFIYFRF
jgi:alginate O-acetyltransferase complex protein AlgI